MSAGAKAAVSISVILVVAAGGFVLLRWKCPSMFARESEVESSLMIMMLPIEDRVTPFGHNQAQDDL
jgi:hypothetical protein